MAYNVYSGNSGRVTRREEPERIRIRNLGTPGTPPARATEPEPPRQNDLGEQTRTPHEEPHHEAQHRHEAQHHHEQERERSERGEEKSPLFKLSGITEGLQSGLSGIFSKITTEMETEDMLILAVLYLLYKETGDDEFLIMLGVMLFL